MWEERDATEAWCPEQLAPVAPWAAAHEYRDACTIELTGPQRWHVAGASRRGRMHAHAGTHREDAMACRVNPHWITIAVADGAGSSRWSRIGAEYTCRVAVDRVAAALTQDRSALLSLDDVGALDALLGAITASAVGAACDEVRALAARADAPPRDFRTTLLLASFFFGTSTRIVTTQVGDGAIVALDHDGGVRRLGDAENGNYSGEVSCFVPDDEACERASRTIAIDASDVRCLLLASDGVEDPFYPVEKKGPVLFSQLIDGVREPAEHFQRQDPQPSILRDPHPSAALLQWLAFERRGENDDRTAVAIYRDLAATNGTHRP
jgi:serine/threonine protein phosphatase PrpC